MNAALLPVTAAVLHQVVGEEGNFVLKSQIVISKGCDLLAAECGQDSGVQIITNMMSQIVTS
jgi:hypothetical protein